MGTVLVAGATGGIGRALTRLLDARRYQVIALGRDPARLTDLCAGLARARTVCADLSRPQTLHAAVTRLPGLDSLDALVYCAGVAPVASVADSPYELWHEAMTVNVVAAAELVRILLPALRSSRGRVVLVNAAPDLRAVPRWSAYVASKAALRALADSLREEEASNGIGVTTVYPGSTATDLLRRVRAAFGRPYDPEACIHPQSLAGLIVTALEAPVDAQVTELSTRPLRR